ncbi:MAG: hypothetical protein GWO08_19135, partial [Gammaproteobacteria bacterium]|nr:hypothetical protein [Gammaproteobacteria bacterium]NIW99430.1 hypothetical protein [Phycisphaerae bacterium]
MQQPTVSFTDFDTANGKVHSSVGADTYVDISAPTLSASDLLAESNKTSIDTQGLSTEQIYQDFYNYTLENLIVNNQIMVVLGSSTANGLIIDAYGKRVGYVNGILINEIPGASYQIADTSQVEVYLLPADGTYMVKSLGASNDFFTLHTLVPKGSNTVQVTSYEDIPTTASSVAIISVSQDNTDFELQSDLNG